MQVRGSYSEPDDQMRDLSIWGPDGFTMMGTTASVFSNGSVLASCSYGCVPGANETLSARWTTPSFPVSFTYSWETPTKVRAPRWNSPYTEGR